MDSTRAIQARYRDELEGLMGLGLFSVSGVRLIDGGANVQVTFDRQELEMWIRGQKDGD